MKEYSFKTIVSLFCFFSTVFLSPNVSGTILNVDPDNYQTIQEAIDASVNGDTVIVADGTYTGIGNKNLNFNGKAITLISQNGPEKSIIDCENDGRGFLFNSGEGENSVVSGFTVTNGYSGSGGGAIYCFNSSPTIKDCIISGNSSGEWGGGICLWGAMSSPQIIACIISQNSVGSSIPGSGGGGIYCSEASFTIKNCIISRNSANNSDGGGISISGQPLISLINCTIVNNSALKGGGVGCGIASPNITNCILWGNSPDSLLHDESANPIVTYSDIQGGFSGEGNFHGDPLFIDPDNDDYHPAVSSPCMDTGTSVFAPDTDIEGNSRPQGGGNDMGAYEVTGYDRIRPVIDSFVADTDNGFIPFPVAFTCNAHDPDGVITGYKIDFGDGSGTETNSTGVFVHNYTVKGITYTTCTVTDDSGAETNSYSIPIKSSREIHVPEDFTTIQAAIDTAEDGDTILVADGNYKGSGNKELDFNGKAITVKSSNGPEYSIIDCENNGRGFYFHSGEGPDSKVSGFTVTNGKALNGGGIYIDASSPSILNCIIKNNSTTETLGDYYGGGIYVHAEYSTDFLPISITNCIVSGNKSGRRGGGIYLFGTDATITNCTIYGNSAGEDFDASGGGIYFSYSNIIMTNCIVRKNSPNQGGVSSGSYSNIEGATSGEGNIDINPAFVDPINGDYHLKDFSPCIGAGINTDAPDTDIAGNPRPDPHDTSPDMGAYENSHGIRIQPPLNIFGMGMENQWTYDGTDQSGFYIFEKEVIRYDLSSFSIGTYVVEERDHGKTYISWYEVLSQEMKLWGTQENDSNNPQKFSKGLTVAWSPMTVGDHRETTGTTWIQGLSFQVRMVAEVVSHENLDLGFDTMEAFKVSYQFRIWNTGAGIDETQTFSNWLVPFIGVIQYRDSESVERLTSFAIGEGTISHQTDADGDSLSDYLELLKYNTNWLTEDSDSDGCIDGTEIRGNRNPNLSDPKGDLNTDCAIDLQDVLIALQLQAGSASQKGVNLSGEVNGNGNIGLEEIIYVLQKVSGLR